MFQAEHGVDVGLAGYLRIEVGRGWGWLLER